jgi:hypothetical protein
MNLLSDAAQSQTWPALKPLIVRCQYLPWSTGVVSSLGFDYCRPRVKLFTSLMVSPSFTPRTPELSHLKMSMSSYVPPRDLDELSELCSRKDEESTLPLLFGKMLPERFVSHSACLCVISLTLYKRLRRRPLPSLSPLDLVTLTRPLLKRKFTLIFTESEVS